MASRSILIILYFGLAWKIDWTKGKHWHKSHIVCISKLFLTLLCFVKRWSSIVFMFLCYMLHTFRTLSDPYLEGIFIFICLAVFCHGYMWNHVPSLVMILLFSQLLQRRWKTPLLHFCLANTCFKETLYRWNHFFKKMGLFFLFDTFIYQIGLEGGVRR